MEVVASGSDDGAAAVSSRRGGTRSGERGRLHGRRDAAGGGAGHKLARWTRSGERGRRRGRRADDYVI
jgi:hypothetical protein